MLVTIRTAWIESMLDEIVAVAPCCFDGAASIVMLFPLERLAADVERRAAGKPCTSAVRGYRTTP